MSILYIIHKILICMFGTYKWNTYRQLLVLVESIAPPVGKKLTYKVDDVISNLSST